MVLRNIPIWQLQLGSLENYTLFTGSQYNKWYISVYLLRSDLLVIVVVVSSSLEADTLQ